MGLDQQTDNWAFVTLRIARCELQYVLPTWAGDSLNNVCVAGLFFLNRERTSAWPPLHPGFQLVYPPPPKKKETPHFPVQSRALLSYLALFPALALVCVLRLWLLLLAEPKALDQDDEACTALAPFSLWHPWVLPKSTSCLATGSYSIPRKTDRPTETPTAPLFLGNAHFLAPTPT